MVSPVSHAAHDVREVRLALCGARPYRQRDVRPQSSELTCGPFQDILDVAETQARLGDVLSGAAAGVVVVDWSLGGVVPHVDRVLGSRLIGVRPLIRSLSEVAGHYGSQKFVTQNLQLVETSGDVH